MMLMINAINPISPDSCASLIMHGYRVGGRGGAGLVLLLAGVAFAMLLVWAIQRSGRSTT
jgi:hypothetical protein